MNFIYNPKKFITNSSHETNLLGKKFGTLIKDLDFGIVVLMFGDLGSGKTVFVHGVGDALDAKNVRSPSFTLINEHKTNTEKFLIHADLYRLDEHSVFSLGLEDYIDDFLFIEWSERLKFDLSDKVVKIFFRAIDKKQRLIEFFTENTDIYQIIQKL